MIKKRSDSTPGDGNIYCWICKREIGVYPDTFFPFFLADGSGPHILCESCREKVSKIINGYRKASSCG